MEIRQFVLGPIRSNCYVVSLNNEALIIDPGFEDDHLLTYLKTQNLAVKQIYITHGHFDHWGGLKALKSLYPDALVLAPLKDRIWMNDSEYNRWGYPAPVDVWIGKGDKLVFQGITFDILETPGHSEGGTILYTDGFAFTGDTLFFQTVGRTDIPFSDSKTLYFSIKKMFDLLDDKTICYPGHGRTTTIGHEKEFNPFVKG